jgi:hypothetical protein
MILFGGKLISYNDASRKLKSLQDDKEDALEELSKIEKQEGELEGEIHQLTGQINIILDQIKAVDLSKALPTCLVSQGYKLTEINSTIKNETPDFWGCTSNIKLKTTILEDTEGNIVREWYHNPSLADLFEVSNV